MSILNYNPQAISISKEIKLQRQANIIKAFCKKAYEDITRLQKMGIDMVWSHPELTSQEIVNALGEDAAKIFQYHGALTTYLVNLAATEGVDPDIKLPTNAFTVENGSITILDEPYIP